MAAGHLGHCSTHRTNGHTSKKVWWYRLLNADAGYVDFMVGHISLLLVIAVNQLYLVGFILSGFIVVCNLCVHVTVPGITPSI